jgi:TonB family protein
MVKVSVLAIALFGIVPLASPAPYFQQQDGQQSGQQQKDATAGAEQLPPCTSTNPHSCGGKVPPKIISAPSPEYTELARKERLTGVSVVSVIVGVDGKAHDAHVVRSISEGLDKKLQPAALELDQKAIEAVLQYRFKPAMYQGKPVPVEVGINVAFRY